MGGGGGEIEETEYEKELGKIYAEQWDYYKQKIVPVENQVIDDAKSSNDAPIYQNIADDVNLGYRRSFAETSQNAANSMAANGVNPNSGTFKSGISKLSDIEASTTADATTRSQIAGQERYIDKMSNVMAMGQGEAQDSVASLNDIAVSSQRKAVHDSNISMQNRDNTLGAISAVGGAATSYYSDDKDGDS